MDSDLEDVLAALAAGDLSVAEARDRIRGVGRVGDVARVDTTQGERTGIPEIVECERKSTQAVVGIGRELLEGTGRAILTDVGEEARSTLAALADESTWYEGSRTLVLHAEGFERPEAEGTVAVVTAGTSDVPVAEQAVAVAEEMGCPVETLYDVGVSGIQRLYDEADVLRSADAVVVAAGREGALATVVAGLVAAPVVGLPVGTGTGYGGGGEAALMGMLQSCTYLTVVNVDAGFRAGAQAALIAR
ncbi:MAG: nickel pincer cofactor biosynthesis protein LarB [Halobacteriaceae archaeon]